MSEALARVPALAAQHFLLAMAALALALAIALPLGLWSARRPTAAKVVLGAVGLVQTIPGLALLALFFPMLLWLGSLVGGGIPALGFLPALLALTLYALLPIIRNLVTGLNGVDPALVEAADGIGMTARQKLWWVEAPLVLPILAAGIRTAAVWTVGAATLSSTVGQPSLGDLIFAGLQTQAWNLVLAGCIGAAGLALGVDALLALVENGLVARSRARVWTGLAALVAALLLAAAPYFAPRSARPHVAIGVENFSEQYILARLVGARLRAAGYDVEYREGLGSAVAFGAVSSGSVDLFIGYAGTIWAGEMHRIDVPPRAALIRGLGEWTQRTKGVRLLGPLGFENAYAFAMRGPDAKRRGIATLTDLARAAPGLRLGTDLEFLDRVEWRGVRGAYGLSFASATPFAPTFMYRALSSNRVDVITAFSSDGRVAADKLMVLTDPKGAIPSYDAVLLLAPKRAQDARFVAAVQPLIGRIPVTLMRQANYMVDRDADKATPDEAAAWLAKHLPSSRP